MSKKKSIPDEITQEEEEAPFVPEVEVTGSYPHLSRKRTGLYSLDYALQSKGELGLPLRNIVELYGYAGVGKSTLAYFLAGCVAERDTISVCDIEMLDRDYVRYATGVSGFRGRIHLIDGTKEDKFRSHEEMLMELSKELNEDSTGAAVIDSVSAIQPIAEAQGDFGEAFMGKRAKLVGQVSRSLSGVLRNKQKESAAFIVNHVYQILGGRGHTTAGGVLLGALAGVRLMLWTAETFSDDKDANRPIGFLVKGQVEKLRFGGKGGEFQFYIVPGFGVHPGVSAMFDCFELGIAKRDARVKLGDKSMGYLKADLLSYAAEGKTRKFLPFQEELSIRAEKDMQSV